MDFNNLHALNVKSSQQHEESEAFSQYHTDTRDMLPFYPIHWHEEMEIAKVQSGKGMVLVDGKEYVAEQGDVFILRPFVMHSFNSLAGCDMSVDAIVFNLRLVEAGEVHALNYFAPLLNEQHSVPCIVRPSDSWYQQFQQSLTATLSCDVSKDGAESDVKANLHAMMSLIYDNRLTDAKQSAAEDKRLYTVRRALEYIRAEYASEITIENVAKHCGYSEFYLMKLFKQLCGVSIMDYVNNYRLTVAGRQLRDTQEDVSTIAHQVGYHNVSYFNRQFKRLYGTTPRTFRAPRRWGD